MLELRHDRRSTPKPCTPSSGARFSAPRQWRGKQCSYRSDQSRRGRDHPPQRRLAEAMAQRPERQSDRDARRVLRSPPHLRVSFGRGTRKLIELLHDDDSRVRFMAIKEIHDRGIGKPRDHSNEADGRMDLSALSHDERQTLAALLAKALGLKEG